MASNARLTGPPISSTTTSDTAASRSTISAARSASPATTARTCPGVSRAASTKPGSASLHGPHSVEKNATTVLPVSVPPDTIRPSAVTASNSPIREPTGRMSWPR